MRRERPIAGVSMRKNRQRRLLMPEMAPMIDCVFLLLIFFMVATTFAPMPGLSTKLPPASTTPMDGEPPLLLRIADPEPGAAQGMIVLNNELLSMHALFAALLNTPPAQKPSLVIQAGRQVFHEQIVRVIDMAKSAGMDNINFAKVPEY